MSDARYLIRLANTGAHQPVEASSLLSQVNLLVRPHAGKAINLRVSRLALEFDVFCPAPQKIDPFLAALQPLGRLLTCRRLDLIPSVTDAKAAIQEARTLFNEERYWEVHEVLEGPWRSAPGSEKTLLQGIIMACAALVHLQKNDPEAARDLFRDAAARLEGQPERYHGWPVKKLLEEVHKALDSSTAHFWTV